MHRERIDIYRWHAQLTCSLNPFPFVLIDWADVREQLRMMTLRASIAVNGRSVVLYERTFEFKHYNSPRSHQRFSDELKQVTTILPEGGRGQLHAHSDHRCRLPKYLVSSS
ncbi:hypothetical protein K1M91_18315 [Motilimonas sp. E26]|nr:hypothetical protein [Motilimonas sp. E26]